MGNNLVDKLMKIGFTEYQAKAYIALTQKNPVTGYELSKLSGVPRSMIYEVIGKIVELGAAMTLRTGGATKYAPVPAKQFFGQLQREHQELISDLNRNLSSLAAAPDMEYVWNLEGYENIIGRAVEMIEQASERIYLTLLPITFPHLETSLIDAVERGLRVVIYTTSEVELPGAQIAVAQLSEETLNRAQGLGLILVVDSTEMLIAEWLEGAQARASWTSSPLLVFIAEHHLRTDLYLPQILAMLGDKALDIIQEEDRELFSRALESHT